MIADVTHFTKVEGGRWYPWPFRPSVKPSNPELLTAKLGRREMTWRGRAGDGVVITFHALRLSDGAIWDSYNGFRDEKDKRPH